jgi:hypothetical protein
MRFIYAALYGMKRLRTEVKSTASYRPVALFSVKSDLISPVTVGCFKVMVARALSAPLSASLMAEPQRGFLMGVKITLIWTRWLP